MTLARTVTMGVLVGALSLGIAAFGREIFYLHALGAVWAGGHGHAGEPTAEALERDIRGALPPGSSRIAVETALRSRRIDYEFVSGDELDALARGLEGGTAADKVNLTLRFHFDRYDRLRSVDSQVVHIGD